MKNYTTGHFKMVNVRNKVTCVITPNGKMKHSTVEYGDGEVGTYLRKEASSGKYTLKEWEELAKRLNNL